MVDLQIQRGEASWTYYYVVLAIILSFEASAIQIWGATGWWALLAHTVVFVVTIWVFKECRWVHNKLSGFKASYENKFR